MARTPPKSSRLEVIAFPISSHKTYALNQQELEEHFSESEIILFSHGPQTVHTEWGIYKQTSSVGRVVSKEEAMKFEPFKHYDPDSFSPPPIITYTYQNTEIPV